MGWQEKYRASGEDLSWIWDRLDDGTLASEHRMLREGNTRRTYLVCRDSGRDLIVKHWFPGRAVDRVRRLYGRPAAVQEVTMAREAHERGRSIHGPLSYAEHRSWGMLIEGCLIHLRLPGLEPLSRVMRDPGLDPATTVALARAVGEELAKTHAVSLRHGDYKLDNLICDRHASEPALHLIDWGLASLLRPGDRAARLEEIRGGLSSMRFALAHRSDELRASASAHLFAGYARHAPWFAADRKSLVQTVERAYEAARSRSARRVIRRCTIGARPLRRGRKGRVRYLAFRDEPVGAIVAACGGEPGAYRKLSRDAGDLWRAANVLRWAGRGRGGVVALLMERQGLGRRLTLLVDDSGGAFDPGRLMAEANAHLAPYGLRLGEKQV